MKKWLLGILTLLCGGLQSLHAQQDWSWVFGDSIVMRFPNGGAPEVDSLARTRHSIETMSCISDSAGELLLYANFDSLYNRQNEAIIRLYTYGEVTDGVATFPIWGDASRYMVFYLSSGWCTTAGCPMYAIVNIDSDSVIVETHLSLGQYHLANPYSEKLAIVRDASGTGWWAVMHGGFDNVFIKHHIVGNIVSPLPTPMTPMPKAYIHLAFVTNTMYCAISP